MHCSILGAHVASQPVPTMGQSASCDSASLQSCRPSAVCLAFIPFLIWQAKYVAADLCKAGPETFAQIAAALEGLEASGAG